MKRLLVLFFILCVTGVVFANQWVLVGDAGLSFNGQVQNINSSNGKDDNGTGDSYNTYCNNSPMFTIEILRKLNDQLQIGLGASDQLQVINQDAVYKNMGSNIPVFLVCRFFMFSMKGVTLPFAFAKVGTSFGGNNITDSQNKIHNIKYESLYYAFGAGVLFQNDIQTTLSYHVSSGTILNTSTDDKDLFNCNRVVLAIGYNFNF